MTYITGAQRGLKVSYWAPLENEHNCHLHLYSAQIALCSNLWPVLIYLWPSWSCQALYFNVRPKFLLLLSVSLVYLKMLYNSAPFWLRPHTIFPHIWWTSFPVPFGDWYWPVLAIICFKIWLRLTRDSDLHLHKFSPTQSELREDIPKKEKNTLWYFIILHGIEGIFNTLFPEMTYYFSVIFYWSKTDNVLFADDELCLVIPNLLKPLNNLFTFVPVL